MRLAIACLVCASSLLGKRNVEYELRFAHPEHREAQITATFRDVPAGALEIRMSRSSPGRYALHEFVKNVYSVSASDENGRALAIQRTDPSGWEINGHHGTVVFSYTLFADHLDGTYAAVDGTHAHLNPPAVFVWARGFEQAPVAVRCRIPNGSNWLVATQLARAEDGSWSAPNLEQLMDSPIEMSAYALAEWTVGGAHFRLALHQQGSEEDVQEVAAICRKIVAEEAGVFGRFPAYDNGSYTFLLDNFPWASGDGMEHRDSTVITGVSERKMQIEAVAHEFFHSWNVRRIRPASLEPFDFDRANMSGELWFAEGFTNYYGILATARAGLSSIDEFVKDMGHAINIVLTAPGRNIGSAVEMSDEAQFVDAARSIDETNRENTYISYYTYGQALALGIDLTIRQRFPGKSLDDWMRLMWREHPDIAKPYTLADLQNTLGGTVADPQFAADLFHRHIEGKEPIDYAPLLMQAGMLLEKSQPGAVYLGVTKLGFSEAGVALDGNALRGSPLFNAGLDRGDTLLRFDGRRMAKSEQLKHWLEGHKPGDHVKLQARTRGGEEREVEVILAENPALRISTYEQTKRPLTENMTRFRRDWLGSKNPFPQN